MTFVTVKVSAPLNRRIFINGDYVQPAGNSSRDSFTVPAGGYVFETLKTSDDLIDYRKRFRVRSSDSEVTVALDPVTPPEQP